MEPTWAWRLTPETAQPTPSHPATATQIPNHHRHIWVDALLTATAASPAATHVTAAVLTHPSRPITNVRIRLFQEVAIRRHPDRRRARPVADAAQWTSALTLGARVQRGGLLADRVLLEGDACRLSQSAAACQWTFAARLPRRLPRSWTWAACEGERSKLWFLDLRYRVVAEAFHQGRRVVCARNFVTLNYPSPTAHSVPLPLHGNLEHAQPRTTFERSRDSVAIEKRLRQSRPNHCLPLTRSMSHFPTRAAKPSPGATPPAQDRTSASKPRSLMTNARRDGHTTRQDCDDMTVTTTIHSAHPNEAHAHGHAQLELCDRVAATITIVPKTGLRHLQVSAVLTEVVEVVEASGTRQIDLQHHYRMVVTRVAPTAGRGRMVRCVAELVAGDELFTADTAGEVLTVRHRVDTSVSYERRRMLGRLAGGTSDDGWGAQAHRRKLTSTTTVRLRQGERVGKGTTVPKIATWGSTSTVAAVGTAESRAARRKPGWACDGGETHTEAQESTIDVLRSLAYANGVTDARRREVSDVGEEGFGFPTFVVHDGALAHTACPVCLEMLSGVVTMLPCLHAGHRGCLRRSQRCAAACPVCRLDLRGYVGARAGDSVAEAA